MAVACFNIHERLVPYLRAETARSLADQGMRQERIAEHLAVSQAMVSKYLRKPPRPAPGVDAEQVRTFVLAAVAEVVAQDERGAVGAHCPVCTSLDEAGLFRSTMPLPEVEQCVRHDRPVPRKQRERVLRELQDAEAWIRRADLKPLQPAVRMNLACSVPGARDARDVAAFPGRLVELKGRVSAVATPDFGSSSHLAGLLLRIQKKNPEIRAILNIRWDAAVEAAAQKAKVRLHPLKRHAGELAVRSPTTDGIDGFVDPGDFGIEPSLYLVGPEPKAVVERAIRLRTKMTRVRTKVA
jgi:predicted fused transcriptional regulator/phosphomethylpyrimidine kinase/predicted transcriptional regulator